MIPILYPVPVGIALFIMFFSGIFLSVGLDLGSKGKSGWALLNILLSFACIISSIGWAFSIGSGG